VLPLHGTIIRRFPELPVFAHEFGNALCSARLQAGICAIPKCPPEEILSARSLVDRKIRRAQYLTFKTH
jgi:hypothetical protein